LLESLNRLMDTTLLHNFAVVARYGSFSKAAIILGVTQSALGRQVMKLEAVCGGPLLHRNGRGVFATDLGRELLDKALPVATELGGILSSLASYSAQPQGTVRVGLTPTVCEMLGIELIDEVARAAPDVTLDIATGYSGYIHEWLMSERVDLAVLHHSRQSPHLLTIRMGELPLSLISSPRAFVRDIKPYLDEAGHLPGELMGRLRFVLSNETHGLRRLIEQSRPAGAPALDIPYVTDSMRLTLQLVMQGRAHTILAPQAISQAEKDGELRSTPIRGRVPLVTVLMMATRANLPMSPAVRLVQKILRALLERHTYQEPHEPVMPAKQS